MVTVPERLRARSLSIFKCPQCKLCALDLTIERHFCSNCGAEQHPLPVRKRRRSSWEVFKAACEMQRQWQLQKLLKPGWLDGVIREAVERPSARGNMMIELGIAVPDGRGGERRLQAYLINTPCSAHRLHRACEAVGALDRYNARAISPDDFIGKAVRVKVSVHERYGNIIEDFATSETRVVRLPGGVGNARTLPPGAKDS